MKNELNVNYLKNFVIHFADLNSFTREKFESKF